MTTLIPLHSLFSLHVSPRLASPRLAAPSFPPLGVPQLMVPPKEGNFNILEAPRLNIRETVIIKGKTRVHREV